jgi:hypothetical protein
MRLNLPDAVSITLFWRDIRAIHQRPDHARNNTQGTQLSPGVPEPNGMVQVEVLEFVRTNHSFGVLQQLGISSLRGHQLRTHAEWNRRDAAEGPKKIFASLEETDCPCDLALRCLLVPEGSIILTVDVILYNKVAFEVLQQGVNFHEAMPLPLC